MNRKDNMVVAILLNAVLLVILFFSFVKKEDPVMLSKEVKVPQKKGAQMMAAKAVAPLPPELKPVPVPPSPPVALQAPVAPPEVVEVPPPPKEVKKEPLPNAKTYVVQKGDSLDKIARRLNVTVDDMMRINDLVETRLTVGQSLLVPEAKALPVPKVIDSEAKYYVVRGGDNPWTIAQKNHLQVEELLRLNNMDEAKAKRLKPGDKLRIR